MLRKTNNFFLKKQIPPTITRILLDRYKWDGQTLTDKFFIMGDDKFFPDARIIDPHKYKKVEVTTAQCGICFETTVSIS